MCSQNESQTGTPLLIRLPVNSYVGEVSRQAASPGTYRGHICSWTTGSRAGRAATRNCRIRREYLTFPPVSPVPAARDPRSDLKHSFTTPGKIFLTAPPGGSGETEHCLVLFPVLPGPPAPLPGLGRHTLRWAQDATLDLLKGLALENPTLFSFHRLTGGLSSVRVKRCHSTQDGLWNV